MVLVWVCKVFLQGVWGFLGVWLVGAGVKRGFWRLGFLFLRLFAIHLTELLMEDLFDLVKLLQFGINTLPISLNGLHLLPQFPVIISPQSLHPIPSYPPPALVPDNLPNPPLPLSKGLQLPLNTLKLPIFHDSQILQQSPFPLINNRDDPFACAHYLLFAF